MCCLVFLFFEQKNNVIYAVATQMAQIKDDFFLQKLSSGFKESVSKR